MDNSGAKWGGVVEVLDPKLQAAITEVRTSGLNIMMSMKEAGKPISFVEDCAVPLEHLADYTARLTDISKNTARAAPGMRMPRSAACMCARCSICGWRRTYTRCAPSPRRPSRWCANTKARIPASMATASCARNSTRRCSARELVHAFEEVKDRFDPHDLFNPGKIVRAPKFDDRGNFRYGPDYHAEAMTTALDWSAYPGAGGGFQGAVEMCNNNGACRALSGGVMCPSYRVTRDERDVTRGRANYTSARDHRPARPGRAHLR